MCGEFYCYTECKYTNYVHVFTDGSKDPATDITGSTVFMAFEWIEPNRSNNVVVCSDPVSALFSLMSGVPSNFQDLLFKIDAIYSSKKTRH